MICDDTLDKDDTNSLSQSSMSVDDLDQSPVKSFLQKSWYEEVERLENKHRTKHYTEEVNSEQMFKTFFFFLIV